MSTRHVWEKFNVSIQWEEKTSSVTSPVFTRSDIYKYCGLLAEGATKDEATHTFTPWGQTVWIPYMQGSWSGDAKTYHFVFPLLSDEQVSTVSVSSIFRNTYHPYDDVKWRIYGTSDITPRLTLISSDVTSTEYDYDRWYFNKTIEKGPNSQGKASSARSTAYPVDGANADHTIWYEYLGSDSIDPLTVACSPESPAPGETVQIKAVPGSNLFGGTISYQYYYSLNGGWRVELGSKTTAASVSFTIPANTQKIQFSAVASDDLGFTSSTVVSGPVLSAGNVNGYIGVGDKARKIEKVYIGVGGKAREVTAIYVGVNGKARKIM